MWRKLFVNFFVFATGCLLVFIPFCVRSSVLQADEAARGEPTMGPGIIIFIGMVLAPAGGAVALAVKWALRWCKDHRRVA